MDSHTAALFAIGVMLTVIAAVYLLVRGLHRIFERNIKAMKGDDHASK